MAQQYNTGYTPATLASNAVSTSSDAGVQAIANQSGKSFGELILDPGTGASAGQYSFDNSVWFDFSGGTGYRLINTGGMLPNGVWLRRVQGGSDLTNARVMCF